jgi:hypothetical protein
MREGFDNLYACARIARGLLRSRPLDSVVDGVEDRRTVGASPGFSEANMGSATGHICKACGTTFGVRFRYDAPARCPNCRSTREKWGQNPNVSRALYD